MKIMEGEGHHGAVITHAGRGRPAGASAAVRARPEQGPGQRPRAGPVQDHPDRFPVRCPVPVGDRSHGARRRTRSAWLARLIQCPTAVNRSFPAAVNAQSATAIKQASG